VRLGDCDRLLERSIKLDHIKSAPATMAAGMKALGTYHRTQYIDVFEKIVASDQRAEVMNAAAGALGEYFGEKEATRKQIVEPRPRSFVRGIRVRRRQRARKMVDLDLLADPPRLPCAGVVAQILLRSRHKGASAARCVWAAGMTASTGRTSARHARA
jgi:hypothetical protein